MVILLYLKLHNQEKKCLRTYVTESEGMAVRVYNSREASNSKYVI